MKTIDARDVFVARLRTIQGTHPTSHKALTNWGLWSADRRGIFPGMKPPGLWAQFKRDENEDWGEETAPQVTDAPVKAEAPDRPPYDEKLGYMLDERIHAPGGLPLEHRRVIRAAYVFLDAPDYQLVALAGVRNEDAFCELLEGALLFTGRFV